MRSDHASEAGIVEAVLRTREHRLRERRYAERTDRIPDAEKLNLHVPGVLAAKFRTRLLQASFGVALELALIELPRLLHQRAIRCSPGICLLADRIHALFDQACLDQAAPIDQAGEAAGGECAAAEPEDEDL